MKMVESGSSRNALQAKEVFSTLHAEGEKKQPFKSDVYYFGNTVLG
jgi:hypothetical protein